MNYRSIAMKAVNTSNDQHFDLEKGDVLHSMFVKGKLKHLYNIKRNEISQEEYDKEVIRCKNLVPITGKWVKSDPYDDIVLNLDNDTSSFASDDLDKPDSSDELDHLESLSYHSDHHYDSQHNSDDDYEFSDDY